ncbi:MAG: M48 family metallopeptidase [Candidatus Sumerlaeia bacterium]|nr:M48 family metallopeptidase [Candidatus Sumerlaeia bacterium]
MDSEFAQLLSRLTGRPVRVRLNDNVRTLVSTRGSRGTGPLEASIHRLFLHAPADVQQALAEFLVRPDRGNRSVIRRYAALQRDSGPEPGTPRVGSPQGQHYDLLPIACRNNAEHFGDALDFTICWGKRPRTRPRPQRNILLGTCCAAHRLVRIHPILDAPDVPPFFLDFIVFHEMLHLAVPAPVGPGGRSLHHCPEFRRRERQHPNYRAAIAWQDAHIDRILRRWRRVPASPPDTTHDNVQGTLF